MIQNIHTLRGIAALMVVLHHCLDILFRNGAISIYPPFGMFGVDIFFVISGFIIVVSTKEYVSAKSFALKRIFRIVPIYWIITVSLFLLLFALNQVSTSENNPSLTELFRSLFFIPYEKANGAVTPILFVGWTLQYEFLFYLIFFQGLLLKKYIDPLYFSVVAILGIALSGIFVEQDQLIAWFYSRPIILTFIGGLLLARLWQKRLELTTIPHPAYSPVLLIPGILLLLISTDHNPFVAGIGATLIVASLLLLEHHCQFYSNRLTRFFGDISFSLYLIHPIVFYGFEAVALKLSPNDTYLVLYLGILVSFLVACCLSWISFRLIETPVSNYSRKWLKG